MKKLTVIVCIGLLIPIWQCWAQDLTEAIPEFDLISTRETNEVRGGNYGGAVKSWRMDDPSKLRCLIISIKATFPPNVNILKSSGLTLSYANSIGEQRTDCMGVTILGLSEKGGSWFLLDPGKTSIDLNAVDGTLKSSFLFVVPPTISEASLLYHDKLVLKIKNLTWK